MAPFKALPTSKVDHLTEDRPIPEQLFVALSFLAPEDVIVRKDAFATKEFLRDRCDKLKAMLDELETVVAAAAVAPVPVVPAADAPVAQIADVPAADSQIADAPVADAPVADALAADAPVADAPGLNAKDLVRGFRERHEAWLDAAQTEAEFGAWMADNQTDIDQKYAALHGGVCCTRGVKVRGSFPTLDAAKARCQLLRAEDPLHDVYVAEVGKWCPWSASAAAIKDVTYAESQLNALMAGYRDKADAKQADFVESKSARVAVATEEGRAGGAQIVSELPDGMFEAPGDAHEAAAAEAQAGEAAAEAQAGEAAAGAQAGEAGPAPKKKPRVRKPGSRKK